MAAICPWASGGYYWRFIREIPVRTAAPKKENVEVRVFGIGTIEVAARLQKWGFQIAELIAVEADQGDIEK